MSKINIKGVDISIVSIDEEDYISLTDMVKGEEGVDHIRNWMRNRNTVEYLGLWENLNNPEFKPVEFDRLRKEAGLNSFNLTPKKWAESTGAKGIMSKSGKYGGTYAHKDIAFHFGMWISPEFNLLLIKEFQRLKQLELKSTNQLWDFRRFLSKANYKIQTDAVKDVLIPLKNLPKEKEGYVYAEEADLLYVAMFGYTSKQWREQNPTLSLNGKNLREYADTHQLIVLNNLEILNAELIRNKIPIDDRLVILRKSAHQQLRSLQSSTNIEDSLQQSPNRIKLATSGDNQLDNAFKDAFKKGKPTSGEGK